MRPMWEIFYINQHLKQHKNELFHKNVTLCYTFSTNVSLLWLFLSRKVSFNLLFHTFFWPKTCILRNQHIVGVSLCRKTHMYRRFFIFLIFKKAQFWPFLDSFFDQNLAFYASWILFFIENILFWWKTYFFDRKDSF